jgi:hypothetical protein
MSGRGRLNSLDLVPAEGQDAVVWAIGALNARERTQEDIRFELNDRLVAVGCEPISRSAFNRASLRLSDRARRIAERRTIYAGIAEELTPDKVADVDVVLGEFLKTLIDELLDDTPSTKGAMELSRAYRDIVTAQRLSSDARRKAEDALAAKTARAVEAVGAQKGLTPETVEAIKARILGVAA